MATGPARSPSSYTFELLGFFPGKPTFLWLSGDSLLTPEHTSINQFILCLLSTSALTQSLRPVVPRNSQSTETLHLLEFFLYAAQGHAAILSRQQQLLSALYCSFFLLLFQGT